MGQLHIIPGDGGEALFRPESASAVELVDSTTFTSGVVVLTYRPTRP